MVFDIVLTRFPDKYDAFCVFDADNIASNNFFEEMNKKLCQGELIVQGYRDIKIQMIIGLQETMLYFTGP